MKTSIETHVPLSGFPSYPEDEMRIRARAFHDSLATRRSVRAFSDKPVPREIIEACVAAAGSAPSGANHQPWFFATRTIAPVPLRAGDVFVRLTRKPDSQENGYLTRGTAHSPPACPRRAYRNHSRRTAQAFGNKLLHTGWLALCRNGPAFVPKTETQTSHRLTRRIAIPHHPPRPPARAF